MDFLIVILLVIIILIGGAVLKIVISKDGKNELEIKDFVSTTTKEISTGNSEIIMRITKELWENNEKLIKRFGDLETGITAKLGTNNSEMVGKFGSIENNIVKGLVEFNNSFKGELNQNIDKLMGSVETKLDRINSKVEDKLTESFDKTNKTFNNVIMRLAKIDEAQKNIEALSSNVVSLQDILTDKKTRGIFGEVQLNQILDNVYGEQSDKTYRKQYKLSNNTIVDSVVFTPEPMGNISVDSKFPLENYKRSIDNELSESERKEAVQKFKRDMFKHINDISEKYIIPGETANQAILFVPAEAIFCHLNSNYEGMISYAHSKSVYMASPTTLMALLSTIQIINRDVEREKYSKILHEELIKLSEEFNRYNLRWDSLVKDMKKVNKDIDEINITAVKISKKFDAISNAEVDDNKKKLIEGNENSNLSSDRVVIGAKAMIVS